MLATVVCSLHLLLPTTSRTWIVTTAAQNYFIKPDQLNARRIDLNAQHTWRVDGQFKSSKYVVRSGGGHVHMPIVLGGINVNSFSSAGLYVGKKAGSRYGRYSRILLPQSEGADGTFAKFIPLVVNHPIIRPWKGTRSLIVSLEENSISYRLCGLFIREQEKEYFVGVIDALRKITHRVALLFHPNTKMIHFRVYPNVTPPRYSRVIVQLRDWEQAIGTCCFVLLRLNCGPLSNVMCYYYISQNLY